MQTYTVTKQAHGMTYTQTISAKDEAAAADTMRYGENPPREIGRNETQFTYTDNDGPDSLITVEVASGTVCPNCLGDVYKGDHYCGDCGINLTDGYHRNDAHERSRITQENRKKQARKPSALSGLDVFVDPNYSATCAQINAGNAPKPERMY